MAVHASLLALMGSWECDEYGYLVFPQNERQGSVLRMRQKGAQAGQHRWFPNVLRVSDDGNAVYWGATCWLDTNTTSTVVWTSLRSGSLWTWSRAVASPTYQPLLRPFLWSWDGSLNDDPLSCSLDTEMERSTVLWMMKGPLRWRPRPRERRGESGHLRVKLTEVIPEAAAERVAPTTTAPLKATGRSTWRAQRQVSTQMLPQ